MLVSHAERAHSKISPSKLKNLELCPGYLADTNREVHAITLQGTKIHQSLDSGKLTDLTEEEQNWARMCLDYEMSLSPKGATFVREPKLEIVAGIWGFADHIIFPKGEADKVAHLVDYKFGQNAQEDVETNPAAQAYVLGMFQKWPGLETIHVHYLYPRREEISKHTYTRKDVPMIRLRVETIVARVQAATICPNPHCDNGAVDKGGMEPWGSPISVACGLCGGSGHMRPDPEMCNPVPDNCQWCSRKSTCTALHKMVLPLATRYANNHDISLVEPDFSVVKSPEQWSALLAYAPVLEQMSDSIKRHALEFREQTGVEIPGYEMRSRQGKKKILNAQMAYEVAMAAGVEHHEYMACVEVSAKQLADAVGAKAPRGQKAKRVAEVEGKLRDSGVLESGAESYFLGRVRA